MAFRTNTLLNVTALTGATTGPAFSMRPDGRDQRSVNVSITGTATVAVQGSHDGTKWQTIKSVAASEGFLAAHYPLMRVDVSGATTADVKVTVDAICKQVV